VCLFLSFSFLIEAKETKKKIKAEQNAATLYKAQKNTSEAAVVFSLPSLEQGQWKNIFSTSFGLSVIGNNIGIGHRDTYLRKIDYKYINVVGLDFSYSLFPSSSLLWVGIVLDKQWILAEHPNLSLIVGVQTGPGFTRGFAGPTTWFGAQLDLGMILDLDDLYSIGAYFRPGYIGSSFSYANYFTVIFRFI
jgi:hypothetical protein